MGVSFLVRQSFGSKWPGHQDSNLDQRIQSPLCCHCTMPQNCSPDSNTFLADVQPAQRVNFFNFNFFSSSDGRFIGFGIKNEVD